LSYDTCLYPCNILGRAVAGLLFWGMVGIRGPASIRAPASSMALCSSTFWWAAFISSWLIGCSANTCHRWRRGRSLRARSTLSFEYLRLGYKGLVEVSDGQRNRPSLHTGYCRISNTVALGKLGHEITESPRGAKSRSRVPCNDRSRFKNLEWPVRYSLRRFAPGRRCCRQAHMLAKMSAFAKTGRKVEQRAVSRAFERLRCSRRGRSFAERCLFLSTKTQPKGFCVKRAAGSPEAG